MEAGGRRRSFGGDVLLVKQGWGGVKGEGGEVWRGIGCHRDEWQLFHALLRPSAVAVHPLRRIPEL